MPSLLNEIQVHQTHRIGQSICIINSVFVNTDWFTHLHFYVILHLRSRSSFFLENNVVRIGNPRMDGWMDGWIDGSDPLIRKLWKKTTHATTILVRLCPCLSYPCLGSDRKRCYSIYLVASRGDDRINDKMPAFPSIAFCFAICDFSPKTSS